MTNDTILLQASQAMLAQTGQMSQSVFEFVK
ncbi:hypothetical protein [Lentibacillus songyuanensis]